MKQKEILYILVSLFISVIAWIGFNIYHQFVNSTISENVNIQIKPITPQFDSKIIRDLKSRTNITPLYEIPNEKPSPTPSSPSATIKPSPTISISSPSATPKLQTTISP